VGIPVRSGWEPRKLLCSYYVPRHKSTAGGDNRLPGSVPTAIRPSARPRCALSIPAFFAASLREECDAFGQRHERVAHARVVDLRKRLNEPQRMRVSKQGERRGRRALRSAGATSCSSVITGTSSTAAMRTSRPAPTRLVPFSYFCTWWNVMPIPSASAICDRPRARRCKGGAFDPWRPPRFCRSSAWMVGPMTTSKRSSRASRAVNSNFGFPRRCQGRTPVVVEPHVVAPRTGR
jgi:hypothetical protein